MQIFVDMDGVLADFDAHHEAVFGFRSCKEADNVDWAAVRAHKGFYAGIPLMADAHVLWRALERRNPIVLTGIPHNVEEAEKNKRAWVRRNLGADVRVVCCRSKDKSMYAHRGDVLIDDWAKYRHLWEAKGGVFILHTSAEKSLKDLADLEWR